VSTAWDEIERRIRARGVRVEERLALLALLRDPRASERLEGRREALRKAVEDAVEAVRREAFR
jgi:hypothetical protein